MKKTSSQIADQVLEKFAAAGPKTKDEFSRGSMNKTAAQIEELRHA